MTFNVEIGRKRDGDGWFAVVKTTTGGEPYKAPIGSTGRIEQESLASLLGCVAKFALGFFKQVAWIEESSVLRFARSILHGDEQHKDWLLKSAAAFVSGAPITSPPAPNTLKTDYCWHCFVMLEPAKPAHCEKCPPFEECDVEGCTADGCSAVLVEETKEPSAKRPLADRMHRETRDGITYFEIKPK